jgi:oligopeptide/dipeptide ABC transporter ATP-binding protein
LDPDLVVLDEPTSALDPISRESIIGLLRALQARLGMAFLFISHDLVTVRHMSHRIAVMYLGEIVEEGPIEEVFEDPAHPYTMALLASAPSVDRALSSTPHVVLSGEIPSPIDLPTGCFLASRCPFALDECRAGRPSLDPIGDERRSRCFRMTGALPPISEEEMHMRDPVVDPQEPGATSSLVRPQEGKV